MGRSEDRFKLVFFSPALACSKKRNGAGTKSSTHEYRSIKTITFKKVNRTIESGLEFSKGRIGIAWRILIT